MNVGRKIKEIRRSKGLSQKDVADMINKSESTFKKYENGEIAITVEVLQEVANALGIDIISLITDNKTDLMELIKKRYNIKSNSKTLEKELDTCIQFIKYKYDNK